MDIPIPAAPPAGSGWRRLAIAAGPGLVVMLADTDAGSIITAAQSGAQWGYRLLLLQFLIMPLLFAVQEMTVRLGLGTGKGFAELVLRRFGRGWAILCLATLAISCVGALVTELGGLAGIGQLFGVPVTATVAAAVALIFTMVATGSYRSVERAALLLGLFELVFLVVAWKAAPDGGEVAAQLLDMPLGNSGYLYLLAANLGTSVMPWTVFYQQSASLDKGLSLQHLGPARIDTLLGAVLCQLVTAAVLVTTAATLGGGGGGGDGAALDSVPQIAQAFTLALHGPVGRLVFALGLSGGALVATIVVCLTLAWAVGEVTGIRHSLEHHPGEAPWFYAAFAAILAGGGALVASGISLVRLSLAAGVINALLLPVVLAFLYRLAQTELPPALRLTGAYRVAVATTFAVAAATGVFAGIAGAFD